MITMEAGAWASEAVAGTMAVALPVAVLAGLVSFFSPCVVPLLPGYLSYATGLGAAEVTQGRARRGPMVLGALGFVLGFAVVFVISGTVMGGLGSALFGIRDVITKVLGILVIAVGLIFAGVLPVGRRDLRLSRVPAVGLAASPALGVVFGLGWTPCIGPTLTVVYSLAYNEGSALRGALLAFAYALGLGIPFVLAAVAFSRMQPLIGLVRRHQQLIMRIGGLSMVTVGILLLTGLWDHLMSQLRVLVALFTPMI